MLYHLIKYLSLHFDIPGAGMFLSLSFRAAMGIILALVIGMIFGKRIIRMLQRRQIGEEIRNLGLEGQLQKRGTPTMGGIIILASILIPILLFGDLTNIYVLLMIVSTVWLGLIGFLDDYIKVFRKNKEGSTVVSRLSDRWAWALSWAWSCGSARRWSSNRSSTAMRRKRRSST